jgi:hypothetical protein
MDIPWIPLPNEKPKLCKFCRQPVYWMKAGRTVDAYGNVIHAPPREARVLDDGTVEYRDLPHKCRPSL